LKQSSSRRAGTFIKAGLVSAVLLALLIFKFTDIQTVESVFRTLNWREIMFAAFMYTLAPVGRTLRFAVLLQVKPHALGRLFWAVCLHQAGLRLLPVRTGEAIFPYLYYKALGEQAGQGVVGLIYSRLLDFAGLACIFLAFLAVTGMSGRVPWTWPAWAVLLFLVMSIIAIRLPWLLGVISKILGRMGSNRKSRTRFVSKIMSLLDESRSASLKIRSWPRLMGASLATLLVWAGIFGCFWFLMRPYHVSVQNVVFGGTAASIAGSVPAGGIGNFGTQEAGWTLGFSLAGILPGLALATGLMVNLFTLAVTLVLAVLCLAVVRSSWRQWKESPLGSENQDPGDHEPDILGLEERLENTEDPAGGEMLHVTGGVSKVEDVPAPKDIADSPDRLERD